MILNDKNLHLYAKNGVNVIFSGRHGVGKTEIIKAIFNAQFGENTELKEKWVYFSASTMDPWVDFIGVPKAVENKNGEQVLELIRPARFHDDSIEAIFFDEFNRAPAKVRNAVMELIQFKSINGRKFKNLKVVWAAINPHDEDGTYDVDRLDPAQLDRFEVQIAVPYKVDTSYMKKKHGNLSIPFVEWWNNLKPELKDLVSPRRLDKGIEIYKIGGNLLDVFPKDTNVTDLNTRIKNLSLDDEWTGVVAMTQVEKEIFFSNLSNTQKFEKYILNDFVTFASFIPDDYLTSKIEVKDVDWVSKSLSNTSALNKSFVDTMELKHKNTIDKVLETFVLKTSKNLNNVLRNKNVVITGKFMKKYAIGSGSRANIETILSIVGANVQAAISGNTDYLITPDSDSGSVKATQAKSMGITIMSEDEFHKLYGNITK
jgi:hypothetical protein